MAKVTEVPEAIETVDEGVEDAVDDGVGSARSVELAVLPAAKVPLLFETIA